LRPLKGLSIPEKIVVLFEDRVTEAHRSAIERPLGLTEEQFEVAIPRARDLGVKSGLRITPVYDRAGWWTAEPTQRIAASAVHETLKRNAGEAERHARVYAEFGQLDSFCDWHSKQLNGTIAAYLGNLGQIEVSEEFDYVIKRIDDALASKKGFVEREQEALAA
jgi:hypothetical protein